MSINPYLYNSMIYENTHRASIFSILGENSPKHESKGETFYNEDNWTSIYLLRAICKWSKQKQSKKLKNKIIKQDLKDIIAITDEQFKPVDKKIVIAKTPENLDYLSVNALIGGAYHESWHTLYDYTQKLLLSDFDKDFCNILTGVKWHLYEEDLHCWNNIVSDIRIENLGVKEFPGTLEKMEALQEFIWKKESKMLQDIKPIQIIMGAFRDLGFGYNTLCSNEIINFYKQQDNKIYFDIVNSGPLTHLLNKTKEIGKEDKIGTVKITLQIIKVLEELKKEKKDKEIPKENEEDIDDNSKLEMTQTKDLENDNFLNTGDQILDYARALEIDFKEKDHNFKNIRCDITLIEKATNHHLSVKGEVKSILKEIKIETSSLKGRIRNKILSEKMNDYNFYTNNGSNLAERHLVENIGLLKSNIQPYKPFTKIDSNIDINTCCAIGLDFSASMIQQYLNLLKITLLISDTLETLSCKTFIYSFQKTRTSSGTMLKHIVYKEFEENLNHILEKLSGIRYNLLGSTPTGDAVKYGKQCLSRRIENKKILFIVTDGLPDNNQQDYLDRELKNCNYPIIGIGLGAETKFVKTRFKYSAWAEDFKGLPKEIIKIIYKVFKS